MPYHPGGLLLKKPRGRISKIQSKALKLCENFTDKRISYETLHKMQKRATPIQMMLYRHSLQLHKLYNRTEPNDDWTNLNYQQNFNARNNMLHIVDFSFKQIVCIC